MSIELFERGDKSTTRQIEDAKGFNDMKKEIDKIWRILQRDSSQTSVQSTLVVGESESTQVQHSLLAGLELDDHPQYLLIDGTRPMAGDLDMSDNDINNINVARFGITPINLTPQEGDFYYNPDDKTWNFVTDDATIQAGQELHDRAYNKGVGTLLNGTVVYPCGFFNDEPIACAAKADSYDTAKHPLAIVTSDIAVDAIGKVTTFGQVRDIDTSGLSLGEVFLSDTVLGGMTSTPPVHPNIRYSIGFCTKVHASEGEVFVMQNNLDVASAFNGTMREALNAFAVSDDGITAYVELERGGGSGGDLTMRFSDGFTILDCTPPQTATLTVGTDSSPQENFVYIPFSTKVLTVSTTGWPTEQHIKISYFYLPSATSIQNGEVFITQNWNDADANATTGQGHQSHIGERIRRQGAIYFSGVDGNGADSYFTLGAGTGYFKSTSGVIYQMHKHTVEAFEMNGGGDHAHIVNDSVTAYLKTFNLNDITAMADGTALSNNKYFNLVFWMVGNKTGSTSPLMINLPDGQYTSQSLAEIDADKTAVYDIPREFNKESSTAFFVCRATFQYGSTWTLINVEDLRGRDPTVSGGASTATAQVEFPTNTFRLFDNLDNTKELAYDISGLSTGLTRILTIQDKDITIAGLADITADIATHTAISDAHHARYTDGETDARIVIHSNAVDPHGDRAYSDGLDHDHATPIATHTAISDAHHSPTVSIDIDHDATTNYVAGEHFLQSAITEVGTVTVGNIDAIANYIANTDAIADLSGKATGDIFYWTTALQRLAKGSDGQYLKLNAGIPSWATLPSATDWELASQGTIHATNYVDNDTTYVSSDFTHNDLAGLNDGAVYNHMTDAQITALHAEVTTLAHSALSEIGVNSHATIDTHLASTGNPHGVTKAQVGLSNVDNIADASQVSLGTVTVGDIDAIANYIPNTDIAWNATTVSQAEAEAGTATTDRKWTAERVAQAIDALAPTGGGDVYLGNTQTFTGVNTFSNSTNLKESILFYGNDAYTKVLHGFSEGSDATDWRYYIVPYASSGTAYDWASEMGFNRSTGNWFFETGLDIGNDISTAGHLLKSSNTSSINFSGGNATSSGSNLNMYGGSHATLANDIGFRAGSTNVLYYDHSALTWTFSENMIISNDDANITLLGDGGNNDQVGIYMLEEGVWGATGGYGARTYYDGQSNKYIIQVGSQTAIKTAMTVERDSGIVDFLYNVRFGGGALIDGGAIIDSDSGTYPFYVTRSGGTTQALKMHVDDSTAYITHTQDETINQNTLIRYDIDVQTGNGGTHAHLFSIDGTTILSVNAVGTSSTTPKVDVTGSIVATSGIETNDQFSLTSAPTNAVIRTVDATTDYLHAYMGSSSFGVELRTSGTAWFAHSDINFKDNISYPQVLDKILAVDLIEYDLYGNTEFTGEFIHQIGVSAQQLREHFPMLVAGDDSVGERLTVDYTHMSAIMFAGFKELKAEVDAKDDRIANLESLLTSLTTRIIALESS